MLGFFVRELEVVDGVGPNVFDRHRNRVGAEEELFVFWRNCSDIDHMVDVVYESLMECLVHDYDREAMNLFRLDQGDRFEEFVEGTETSGHDYKAVGVFQQQHFSNEEVPNVDRTVEVGIGLLFEGEFDVDSDTSPADILCAAIGSLHDPWTATGHDGESETSDCCCQFPRLLVVGIVFAQSRRAEDRDGRANEMKGAEPFYELRHHLERERQFTPSRLPSLQEPYFRLVLFCCHSQRRLLESAKLRRREVSWATSLITPSISTGGAAIA